MNDKKKISSNLLWRFFERCGAQGVSFIVTIILARLLDPEVYGTIALVMVFITIIQVFVDSGLGSALIQKKDADDLDFSTVFYFNLIFCIVLYALMFCVSPYISSFYSRPELTPIVRVVSITLIISGLKNVQQAYVSKHLMFKKFFFSTLIGTIGAAILGVWMAFRGYGVWALIAQNIFNNVIDTVFLWFSVKWRPKLMFSLKRLLILLSYGWKLLVSALLDTGYRELRALIIGKLYSTKDLAFYNKGNHLPQLIVTNINSSIDSVLFPSLSAEQDNKERVRTMTRRAIKTSTFLMMPIMMGLAVCAEPLVTIVLTDKWLPCVFFLRIFCFTYSFYPVHTANLNAIKAMGRSDMFLALEIIKKTIGMIALISTMFISVEAMALSFLATSLVNQIINAWPNRKLLDYSFENQLKDMLPQILLSCFMGVCVCLLAFLPINTFLLLLIQVVSGVMIYLIGSKIFKIDSLDYLLGIIRTYLVRKEKKKTHRN